MPDRIERAIEERSDRHLAELRELCAIPSEAKDPAALERAARWCRDRLAAAGCAMREVRLAGVPPLVVGETPREARTLICVQHYDVQPAVPLELWKTPPYEPDVRDGALYARGVSDNKGHLLLRIQALEVYRSLFGDLPIALRFLIEGEEESGSPNLERLLAQDPSLVDGTGALKEGGAVDAGGRPVLSLGNKGILYVELRVRSMARDAHSGGATHLPNAAWRLVAALRSLVAQDGRVLIRGFYDAVRTPTDEQRAAVRALPFEAAAIRRTYALERFAFGRDDTSARDASVFAPTCNICGILSGYTEPGTKTVIPSEAMAKLDFRLVPDQDPAEIARLLRAHLEREGFADVEVHPSEGEHPYWGPLDDPLVHAARAAAEESYGKPAVLLPTSGGTAPMWLVSHPRSLANVTLGMSHVDSRDHAPNENVLLANYRMALAATVRLYRRYGAA